MIQTKTDLLQSKDRKLKQWLDFPVEKKIESNMLSVYVPIKNSPLTNMNE